ncbi:Putative protein [Zobellia galactanivorans]|uniref:Uncharacterized protein n=1 Tax=Zobellia galactanivorans (strain DSM 12802 / CCUG 47099 / CIP 106680 / NCIMB 13871 / Dsij) TaxID=63186 RepID=G0L2F7_ZOBGA|nr:Putative protein [Zobellia galactanivorans]
MLDKFDWKKEYSLVLILNIVYVLIFCYLMTAFT